MAELADALDLGSSGLSRAGSSPVIPVSYTHLDVYKRQRMHYLQLQVLH